MRYPPRQLFILIAGLALITLFYLYGVPQVPFHPDESTYLFMSADAENFWDKPSTLFWRPENTGDSRQQYRLLDPPMTRNTIAAARWVVGLPALPVDWDWGKTWLENEQQGALPSQALLLTGRYAFGVLFPFSILFFFLAVRRATNDRTAILAALLLASNALILLHTRRSMSEGTLLFAEVLAIWGLMRFEQQPWRTAIPAALAFSAKQTLVTFMPVAFLAVLWQPVYSMAKRRKRSLFQMSKQIFAFGGLLMVVVIILHPFLWEQPLPALRAAVSARQELASAQQGDRPEQTLNTIDKKLIGMIGSMYLTPPIFAEVGNYTKETAAAEQAYLSNPFHSLFRSLPAGAILLVLNLFGFATALRNFSSIEPIQRRRLGLLIVATLIQTLLLLLLTPLPWQRYYIPLIPFACLWTAYGINTLIQLGFSLRSSAGLARRAGHLPGK